MHWMTWRAKRTRPCPEVLQEIPLAPERGGVHAREHPPVHVRHNHAGHQGRAVIARHLIACRFIQETRHTNACR